MGRIRLFLLSVFIGLASISLDVSAALDTADLNAQVVTLRANKPDGTSGCIENGAELSNCFTNMLSLTDWIASVRNPSISSPLVVDVGPGKFTTLDLLCNATFTGYTTFRGSGRLNTAVGTGTGNSMNLDFCTSMVFQDMTVGPAPEQTFGAIFWNGTGTSAWQNVDVISNFVYGWQDVNGSGTGGCVPGPRGQHYWFSSRIVMTSADSGDSRAYISRCSEDWLLGSEVSVMPTSGGYIDLFTLKAHEGESEIHFYGGILRGIAGPGVTTSSAGIITPNFSPGMTHIHGAAIDIASADANTITAFGTSGMVHANANAYYLKTGTGGAIKRIDTGHIHAPFQWGESADVPFNNSGISYSTTKGADMAIVAPIGEHPHLVLSDSSCPNGWYDINTKLCR